MPGYRCAVAALAVPITKPEDATRPAGWLNSVDVRFVPVKVSGLINVLFVPAAFCASSVRYRALFKALRIVVLLMMPLCWVAFYAVDLHPREGYYLWTLGMIVVLFGEGWGRRDAGQPTLASQP